MSTPDGLHAPLHPNDDETEALFGDEVAGLASLQALVSPVLDEMVRVFDYAAGYTRCYRDAGPR